MNDEQVQFQRYAARITEIAKALAYVSFGAGAVLTPYPYSFAGLALGTLLVSIMGLHMAARGPQ